MNKKINQYILALPCAVLDYPFGEDIHVYKMESKVFAIYFEDAKVERINLKCDPVHAQELRAIFDEITPGYHINKKHWNTADLKGDLPLSEVFRLIDHSYELIVKKLPRAVKQRFRIQYERFANLK